MRSEIHIASEPTAFGVSDFLLRKSRKGDLPPPGFSSSPGLFIDPVGLLWTQMGHMNLHAEVKPGGILGSKIRNRRIRQQAVCLSLLLAVIGVGHKYKQKSDRQYSQASGDLLHNSSSVRSYFS